MKNSKHYNLCFDMNNPTHKAAYEYLIQRDKTKWTAANLVAASILFYLENNVQKNEITLSKDTLESLTQMLVSELESRGMIVKIEEEIGR